MADAAIMRRRLCFASMVVCLALLLDGRASAFDWPAWMSGWGESEERVLVFLVGSRDRVGQVRAAVHPDRIVVETPDAFALREGRIVAVDVDAVPAPYTEAGWMDREIEIMYLQRVEWWKAERSRSSSPERRGGEADAARQARLRALMQKGTLTAGEQIFLLQAMNDGVVF
jgi:hypothetical protein